jgi:hypothetical protein
MTYSARRIFSVASRKGLRCREKWNPIGVHKTALPNRAATVRGACGSQLDVEYQCRIVTRVLVRNL